MSWYLSQVTRAGRNDWSERGQAVSAGTRTSTVAPGSVPRPPRLRLERRLGGACVACRVAWAVYFGCSLGLPWGPQTDLLGRAQQLSEAESRETGVALNLGKIGRDGSQMGTRTGCVVLRQGGLIRSVPVAGLHVRVTFW